MEEHVKVAIIGAGSAGLYALAQVKKHSDSYVLIDGGELGTTCSRVGCMPSKLMIQVADDFHRRALFPRQGIEGGDKLSLNAGDALEHVQDLRDLFVDKVLSHSTDQMGDEFIPAQARFVAPGVIEAGDRRLRADRVVIATGSSPIVPPAWRRFGERVLTSDSLFELEQLPQSMAVIGLGVIGLELGQALHRLGVKVTGIDQMTSVSRLQDADINKTAIDIIGKEFPLWLGEPAQVGEAGDGRLRVSAGERSVTVDKLLVCIGRRPNLATLNLEAAAIDTGENGVPAYDPHTMQIPGTSVFLAGDVTGERPLLHEAGDDGRIAGFNAVLDSPIAFKRKTPLSITFSDPNIVQVGAGPEQLDPATTLSAGVKFGPLGRALIMGRNKGELKLYARRSDGLILGAAMVAPQGEHLGHLLALAIEQQLSVLQLLRMPFYHPVIEEALQPVLRELVYASELQPEEPVDLQRLS